MSLSRLGPYRYQNPLELEPLQYDALFARRHEGVYLEPPGLPRVYDRVAPDFHDDPDRAGLFPNLGSARVTYSPAFVVSMHDVGLIGHRTILCDDGRFFNDQGYVDDAELHRRYLDRLSRPEDLWIEMTGLRPDMDGDAFCLDDLQRPQVDLPGTIIVLCSREPGNYGSFLYRVLPKLTLAPTNARYRYLVGAPYESMRQLLSLFGVSEDRIILHDPGTIYRIEHAIVPGIRGPDALLDEETRSFYASARERHGADRHDRKIYVSRQGWPGAGRIMQNERQIIDRLLPLGFEIVQPETLSALEQIEIFASARLVAGPSGAGMFNIVFCRPGTHVVDIESEPYWIHTHMCLFGSCGMRYGIFEGTMIPEARNRPPHQPFTVNAEALVERLEALD